jgi:beta-phosphoglucomutase-like phosphatase (HAD superfamily)
VTLTGVVFDFDGLVLDTESPILASWTRLFDDHASAPLTIDEWSRAIGTVGAIDLPALFRSRVPPDLDVDAVHARRRAHRDELLYIEAVRPGITAWTSAAKARAVPLAIASSSSYEWVDGHLRRLGLRDAFEHLACASEDLPAKPDPATYLEACARIGVTPRDALEHEDSPHGVTAARAAGLRVVGVPNSVTKHLDLSSADIVADSLEDFGFDDAVRWFEHPA